MKIIFVDESYKQTGRYNRYYFILCGLIIDSNNILGIEHELALVSQKYKFANFKELRKSNEETKLAVSEEIFKILNKYGSRIIASCIGSTTLEKAKAQADRYEWGLSFLIERFYLYLDKNKDNGLVIFDSIDKSTEKEIRKWFYNEVLTYDVEMFDTPKGKLIDRIYPAILFSDDKYTNILQAIDLIGWSLNSAIWHAIQDRSIWTINSLYIKNPFLEIYWPLFLSGGSRVEGYGIKWWS